MSASSAFLKGVGPAVTLAMLLPLVASAQLTATPDWTVSAPGSTAAMIAVDGGSNAYVAGSVAGATMTLTKISPAGTPLWQRAFDGAGPLSQSTWITLDGAGNAILTGRVVDTLQAPVGMVVVKYDPAGTLLWWDVVPAAYGAALRVTTDAAGNVYALGRLGQPGNSGTMVIKYGPTGIRQWLREVGTVALVPDSMAVAPSGNLIVGGTISRTIFLEALDPGGVPIWFKSIDANSDGTALAMGPGGEFYVVGGGSAATPGFLVVKHDAAFTELARTSYPARGFAQAAALDSAGNLVVVGPVDVSPPCPPGQFCTLSVNSDWMIIKLDSTGALLWSRTRGGPSGFASGNDVPRDLAIGPDGSIYVTGEGAAPVASLGGNFFLPSTMTVNYGPDGTELWAANEATPALAAGSTRRTGIGVRHGSDGGVFVLGDQPQTVFRYGQYGLPNSAPVARASAIPATGAAALKVAFSSAGSLDPDGLVAGYAWSFGDGQTSTDANPSHTYAVGTYTASLIVTDTLGAASTPASVTITANALPPARPTSLTLARTSVTGGLSTTATVRVSSAAGVTVALSSSNSTAAKVPATVVVPAGSTSATFTITTSKVSRNTSVTLRATANGATASATLAVRR